MALLLTYCGSIHAEQLGKSNVVLSLFHRVFVKSFVQALGAGNSHILQHSATIFPADHFSVPLNNERWAVETLNLIGAVNHEGHMSVFNSPEQGISKSPEKFNAFEKRPMATRQPDKFETDAIAQLQESLKEPSYSKFSVQDLLGPEDAIRFQISADEIRVVGPLYARKSCLECHTERQTLTTNDQGREIVTKIPVKVGDLLGALTYHLKRAAKEPPIETVPKK